MSDDPFVDDDVALARIRALCRAFDRADEAQLQDRPLFRVGRRRFAIFNGAMSPDRPRWSRSGRSLHFVASPAELEALSQEARFAESPHHGKRGWLALRLDDPHEADWCEIAELLESAYSAVAPRRSLNR